MYMYVQSQCHNLEMTTWINYEGQMDLFLEHVIQKLTENIEIKPAHDL